MLSSEISRSVERRYDRMVYPKSTIATDVTLRTIFDKLAQRAAVHMYDNLSTSVKSGDRDTADDPNSVQIRNSHETQFSFCCL